MRTGISITVGSSDRLRLEGVVKERNFAQKHVWRAVIILLSAEGVGTHEIMRRTGTSKTCVWRWQERFMEEGVDGLLRDKTRPSRIPPLGPEVAERVVALTLTDPPVEATHWTAAMMATATGISESAVRRIWRSHGLQPHRYRQFKLSNDPNFVRKLRDVVGLYVDPPAHAIVLSVDEKSQIQALDRTQPGLPMKKGRLGTMTHDYKRNGTTTLFAALNVLDGTVIGQGGQMIRGLCIIAIVFAISGCTSGPGGPGAVSSEFGTSVSHAKGLILHFRDWPPKGEGTEPLLRRLQGAGLELSREFPRFKVWVFEWDDWQQGDEAERLCREFLSDDWIFPLAGRLRTGLPATSWLSVERQTRTAPEGQHGRARG